MSRLSDIDEASQDTARLLNDEDSNGETQSPPLWRRLLTDAFATTHAALFSSLGNIFLICVPLGFAADAYNWGDVSAFILNFFAIFALASVLSYATDELSAKVGPTIGGLLNATFGNMVELLVRLLFRLIG